MIRSSQDDIRFQSVRIPVGTVQLQGDLDVPDKAGSVVIFAHGSGSSRHSPRNRMVAEKLRQAGLGTLLMDLLTPAEEQEDLYTAELRFDIALLAERLIGATSWIKSQPQTRHLNVGYFGASTGGGAALVAAARQPELVRAVVCRGGRPDLAGDALPRVQSPTLLIVGGNDLPVIDMNEQAMGRMTAPVRLEIIPGATHLFEEPGALEQVAQLAREWFLAHLSHEPLASPPGDL